MAATERTNMEIDEPSNSDEALKELVLEPTELTAKQRNDIHAVKEAYRTFWDNIKFRKGWEKVRHVIKCPICCLCLAIFMGFSIFSYFDFDKFQFFGRNSV
jgi:hypothetical protein